MSSAGDRWTSSRKSQAPDPVPSQLCEDVKAETSDGETYEVLEVCVKKEETLERKIDDDGDDLPDEGDDLVNTPEDISIKEEDLDTKDYLYCEICKSIFFNKCEVHGPPIFIPDTPAPMGGTDRARQTLPPGLEIQKSGIPNAGLGVFNKRETVPVGVHFGPYQGEPVDREKAMNSGYSWVICRGSQCEEYIDATKEMHANWMRFVNCARNDEEQNLVAFQYQGRILYRCCRPINPGQELLVWYEEKYAKELSPAFDQLWNKKCSTNDINNAVLQVFPCAICPLSYASQIYLDKHIERCHFQILFKDSSSQPSSSHTLSSDAPHNDVQKESQHCVSCGKNFGHQDALKTHQCSQAGEKSHHCSQCGKSFNQKRNLHKHQLIHTDGKPYHCSQCRKRFTYPAAFRKHQCLQKLERTYHCSLCVRRFFHLSALLDHQRIHTEGRSYRCSDCGKSFSGQSALQQHQRLHTGEKPYHCSHCGKSFTQRFTLQQHQHIHTGEKPYQCPQCAKSFTYQTALKRHQRIHTGEKPYHCLWCERSFIQRRNLIQHQHIHTGEKPYHCLQCGKSYTSQRNLQRHQNIHTGEKPYQCSQCGTSFAYHTALKRHQCIHTGEKPHDFIQC